YTDFKERPGGVDKEQLFSACLPDIDTLRSTGAAEQLPNVEGTGQNQDSPQVPAKGEGLTDPEIDVEVRASQRLLVYGTPHILPGEGDREYQEYELASEMRPEIEDALGIIKQTLDSLYTKIFPRVIDQVIGSVLKEKRLSGEKTEILRVFLGDILDSETLNNLISQRDFCLVLLGEKITQGYFVRFDNPRKYAFLHNSAKRRAIYIREGGLKASIRHPQALAAGLLRELALMALALDKGLKEKARQFRFSEQDLKIVADIVERMIDRKGDLDNLIEECFHLELAHRRNNQEVISGSLYVVEQDLRRGRKVPVLYGEREGKRTPLYLSEIEWGIVHGIITADARGRYKFIPHLLPQDLPEIALSKEDSLTELESWTKFGLGLQGEKIEEFLQAWPKDLRDEFNPAEAYANFISGLGALRYYIEQGALQIVREGGVRKKFQYTQDRLSGKGSSGIDSSASGHIINENPSTQVKKCLEPRGFLEIEEKWHAPDGRILPRKRVVGLSIKYEKKVQDVLDKFRPGELICMEIIEFWTGLLGDVLSALGFSFLKLDRTLADKPYLLLHLLAHEKDESILPFVESNHGMRQLVAIYCSVRHFLSLPSKAQDAILSYLSDQGPNSWIKRTYNLALHHEVREKDRRIRHSIIEAVYFSYELAEQFAAERRSLDIYLDIVSEGRIQEWRDINKLHELSLKVKEVFDCLQRIKPELENLEPVWREYVWDDIFRFGQLLASGKKGQVRGELRKRVRSARIKWLDPMGALLMLVKLREKSLIDLLARHLNVQQIQNIAKMAEQMSKGAPPNGRIYGKEIELIGGLAEQAHFNPISFLNWAHAIEFRELVTRRKKEIASGKNDLATAHIRKENSPGRREKFTRKKITYGRSNRDKDINHFDSSRIKIMEIIAMGVGLAVLLAFIYGPWWLQLGLAGGIGVLAIWRVSKWLATRYKEKFKQWYARKKFAVQRRLEKRFGKTVKPEVLLTYAKLEVFYISIWFIYQPVRALGLIAGGLILAKVPLPISIYLALIVVFFTYNFGGFLRGIITLYWAKKRPHVEFTVIKWLTWFPIIGGYNSILLQLGVSYKDLLKEKFLKWWQRIRRLLSYIRKGNNSNSSSQTTSEPQNPGPAKPKSQSDTPLNHKIGLDPGQRNKVIYWFKRAIRIFLPLSLKKVQKAIAECEHITNGVEYNRLCAARQNEWEWFENNIVEIRKAVGIFELIFVNEKEREFKYSGHCDRIADTLLVYLGTRAKKGKLIHELNAGCGGGHLMNSLLEWVYKRETVLSKLIIAVDRTLIKRRLRYCKKKKKYPRIIDKAAENKPDEPEELSQSPGPAESQQGERSVREKVEQLFHQLDKGDEISRKVAAQRLGEMPEFQDIRKNCILIYKTGNVLGEHLLTDDSDMVKKVIASSLRRLNVFYPIGKFPQTNMLELLYREIPHIEVLEAEDIKLSVRKEVVKTISEIERPSFLLLEGAPVALLENMKITYDSEMHIWILKALSNLARAGEEFNKSITSKIYTPLRDIATTGGLNFPSLIVEREMSRTQCIERFHDFGPEAQQEAIIQISKIYEKKVESLKQELESDRGISDWPITEIRRFFAGFYFNVKGIPAWSIIKIRRFFRKFYFNIIYKMLISILDPEQTKRYSPDADVRLATAQSLKMVAQKWLSFFQDPILAQACQELKDYSRNLRATIVGGISGFIYGDDRTKIERDCAVKKVLLEMLAEFGSRETVESNKLLPLIYDDDDGVCEQVIKTIVKINDRKVMIVLKDIAEKEWEKRPNSTLSKILKANLSAELDDTPLNHGMCPQPEAKIKTSFKENPGSHNPGQRNKVIYWLKRVIKVFLPLSLKKVQKAIAECEHITGGVEYNRLCAGREDEWEWFENNIVEIRKAVGISELIFVNEEDKRFIYGGHCDRIADTLLVYLGTRAKKGKLIHELNAGCGGGHLINSLLEWVYRRETARATVQKDKYKISRLNKLIIAVDRTLIKRRLRYC
ncbi:MAG: hypothetical protein ISS44_05095, partial [Candidatus Omnitrophica bacterium]|nr:hypothetical protein [Candidatus Omnitrophota bacterium]